MVQKDEGAQIKYSSIHKYRKNWINNASNKQNILTKFTEGLNVLLTGLCHLETKPGRLNRIEAKMCDYNVI